MESGYRATVKLQQIWHATNRVASNRKTAMKDHSSVKNFEPTSIDYDTSTAGLK